MWRWALTTDEAVAILERYIEWRHCDELDAVPLRDWLATDIVRMIELMDAELQQRADDSDVIDISVCDDEEFDHEDYL